MANSPPLSLIYLAPVPPLKRRSPFIISNVSHSTRSTNHAPPPPPSSYRHTRSRSAELLKTLVVLAPPIEANTDSWEEITDFGKLEIPSSVMAAPPQNPPRKPGFFRRLSLSTSQPQPKVQPSSNGVQVRPPARSASRSTSGPVSRVDAVAGPSYESLSANMAPSAYSNGSVGGSIGNNSSGMRPLGGPVDRSSFGRPVQPKPIPNPSAPTPIAASFIKAQPMQTPSSTPRVRNPIHPALASPPNSPPRRTSVSSPYDFGGPSSPPNRGAPSSANQKYAQHAVPSGQQAIPSGTIQSTSHPTTPRSTSRNHQEFRSPPPPEQTAFTPPPLPQNPTAHRPTPSPLIIPSGTSHNNSARTVVPNGNPRHSRFEDADGLIDRPLPPGAQASMATASRQTEQRGVVSARRSTSSSRRTPVAKVERPLKPEEARITPGKTVEPPREPNGKLEQLSEASAYAKSIAATLSSPKPVEVVPRPAAITPRSNSAGPVTRKETRPLPSVPPQQTRTASGATIQVIASSSLSPRASPKQEKRYSFKTSPQKPTQEQKPIPPALQIPNNQPIKFDFPRSPTLPPLVDPRTAQNDQKDPISKWSESPLSKAPMKSPPLTSAQLPARMSSTQSKRVVSSPSASPRLQPPDQQSRQSPILDRRHPTRYLRGKARASLSYVLSQTRVQTALLPHLSINSFLSLTGSSDNVRKRFTGETVGRWIMKEWGVQVDREKGRTWPNLTVWEGFLESLLHDPSTYSTYDPQWQSLLQHLCLSHTLIVLHLRQLPATSFANPPPSFEDDTPITAPSLPFSNSVNSFASLPRSRMSSVAGSDSGSITPSSRMPRQERLVEIIMPEPLAATPQDLGMGDQKTFPPNANVKRRGSIGSIASVASLSFGRRRSASINIEQRAEVSPTTSAAPMASGKADLPPVSYPMAKRYGFKRHGEPTRSRTSSDSSRPGSIFSVQSSPALSIQHQRGSSLYNGRQAFSVDRNAPPVPGMPAGLPMPPPIGGGPRSSFGSDAGRSSRRSDYGSPVNGMTFARREMLGTPPPVRPEPAFDRPIPFIPGRAPILRIFVPLSDKVQRWPSAEGAAAAVKELEKCGALRRMKMGDLVVNTAVRQPKTTEHVLVYVPSVRHLLLPLDYRFSPTGHLPVYINGFDLPPSYYYPFLPTPQILYLDMTPFARQAMQSLRLAYDRRDVTVASGARMSAKRYLHVTGFEVSPNDRVAPEWQGMISLETEGTAEAKQELEKRLVAPEGAKPIIGAWELVRDKSMLGTIWLRLVQDVRV